jgi:tRNA(Ile)-lysidine synthase
MTLLQRFQKFIDDQHLFLPGDKLVLAVSGGVDSIVLFELCRQTGLDFSVAHCNFRKKTIRLSEAWQNDMEKQYG